MASGRGAVRLPFGIPLLRSGPLAALDGLAVGERVRVCRLGANAWSAWRSIATRITRRASRAMHPPHTETPPIAARIELSSSRRETPRAVELASRLPPRSARLGCESVSISTTSGRWLHSRMISSALSTCSRPDALHGAQRFPQRGGPPAGRRPIPEHACCSAINMPLPGFVNIPQRPGTRPQARPPLGQDAGVQQNATTKRQRLVHQATTRRTFPPHLDESRGQQIVRWRSRLTAKAATPTPRSSDGHSS